MMRLTHISLAASLLVSAIASGGAHAGEPGVDDLVNQQMAVLRNFTHSSSDLSLVDGNQLDVDASGKIVVGRDEVQKILSASGASQHALIVRLLLAHELGHTVEFKRYGIHTVQSDDSEKVRLFECEADLFAGVYLSGSADKPDDAFNQAVIDGFAVIYSLGVTEDTLRDSDHPTKLQREECLRYGLAAGLAARAIAIAQSSSDTDARSEYGASALALTQKLGISGHDWDAWAMEEAKKVVHFRLDAVDLIGVTNESTNVTSGADGLVGTFSATYTNGDSRRRTIDMDVICRSAPSVAPEDARYSRLWGAQHFTFDLEAGASHTVAGSIPCGPGSDPSTTIVIPKMSESLITVG
jgi:hypothetical protein